MKNNIQDKGRNKEIRSDHKYFFESRISDLAESYDKHESDIYPGHVLHDRAFISACHKVVDKYRITMNEAVDIIDDAELYDLVN